MLFTTSSYVENPMAIFFLNDRVRNDKGRKGMGAIDERQRSCYIAIFDKAGQYCQK